MASGAIAAALVGVVGCSTDSVGSSDDTVVNGSASRVVADAGQQTEASGDLFPTDALKVVVNETDGMRGLEETYTLLLPSLEFTWRRCHWTGAGAQACDDTGERTMTAGEYASVASALHGLRTVSDAECWEDAAQGHVMFTTATAETSYIDDKNACNGDERTSVSGIDSALAELSNFAH